MSRRSIGVQKLSRAGLRSIFLAVSVAMNRACAPESTKKLNGPLPLIRTRTRKWFVSVSRYGTRNDRPICGSCVEGFAPSSGLEASALARVRATAATANVWASCEVNRIMGQFCFLGPVPGYLECLVHQPLSVAELIISQNAQQSPLKSRGPANHLWLTAREGKLYH